MPRYAQRGVSDPRDLSIVIASAMAGVLGAAAPNATPSGFSSETALAISKTLSDMAEMLRNATIAGEREIRDDWPADEA